MPDINRQFAKGCSLLWKGRPEEALEVFDAIRTGETPWWLRMHRSLALAEVGRFEDARKEIETCAVEMPGSAPVYIFKARIEWDAGSPENALDAGLKALEMDSTNRLARAYAGLAKLALGEVMEGYNLLRGIAYLMNAAFQSRLLLFIESKLAECEDAIELEKTVADEVRGYKKGNDAPEIGGAGILVRKISSKARHLFKPRLAEAELRESVALWHLMKGNFRRAADEFETASKLLPSDTIIKERLLDAYYELEEYEKVVALAKSAGDPSAWAADVDVVNLKTGAALYKLNRFEEALEHLMRVESGVIEFWPQYYAGLCQMRLSRYELARRLFASGLSQLNPRVAEKRLEEFRRVFGS